MIRKITNFVSLFAFGCAALFSFGCGGGSGGNNQDPNTSFYVQVAAGGIPTVARVQGQFQTGSGTFGNRDSFPPLDVAGIGFTRIADAKVPGTWRLTYGPGLGGSLCLDSLTVDRNVSLGSFETLPCAPRYFSFTASPNSINALSPPATVTFTGKGISALSGIPVVAYYNEFGYVVASTPATNLSNNSLGVVNRVSVSVPDLSNAYDGEYTVAVHNINPDGTWEVIGAAHITIYGNPVPPNPFPIPVPCEQQPPNQEQLPCDAY